MDLAEATLISCSRKSFLPTTSLEADKFKITVAPAKEAKIDGESPAHASSHISMPIYKLT